MKNGAGPDSPLLADGKYCSSTEPPAHLETTGNKLYVKAVGTRSHINFKLMYREVNMACGGSFRVDHSIAHLSFGSPNYPNVPPPYSECLWTFLAIAGERLSLHFTERFDLTISPK